MSVKEYLFTRLRFSIVTVSSAVCLDRAVAVPSNTMDHSWDKATRAMSRPPRTGSKRSSNIESPV